MRTAGGAAASGGASAAVAPASVWASSGPGAGAPREGSGVQRSAPHRFHRPSEGSAGGTDDSVSENQSEAAGMVTPAAVHSHLAAAASVGVFPLAPGWNVQMDRSWSYSWEREPHCQPAVVASAAKTSVFRTSYSPEAWSVLAAALDTGGVEGRAVLVQQREQPGPLAGPVGKVVPGLA